MAPIKHTLTLAAAAALILSACGGNPAEPSLTRADSGGGRLVVGMSPVQDGARMAASRDAVGALHADGTVFAWGSNQYGQLGRVGIASSATPVMVAGLSSIKEVRAGGYHMAAIRQDGTVWTWGNNSYGQLGVGGLSAVVASARMVPGLSDVKSVAAGYAHTVAVNNGGLVWGWGSYPGRNSTSPLRISGLPGTIRSVAAGFDFNLALAGDGAVYSWGGNDYGQLGNGARSSAYFPVRVYGLDKVAALSAGFAHTLALREDGSVWAWGSNADGQLGAPSGDAILARPVAGLPTPIGGLAAVKALVAGARNSAVVYADGSVWIWGNNANGQLGDGSLLSSSAPQRLNSLPGVAAITIGEGFVSILKSDGTVYGIGANNFGKLGNNTTVPSRLPVQVVGLSGVGYLSLGADAR